MRKQMYNFIFPFSNIFIYEYIKPIYTTHGHLPQHIHQPTQNIPLYIYNNFTPPIVHEKPDKMMPSKHKKH
jgi:hypothetical protein